MKFISVLKDYVEKQSKPRTWLGNIRNRIIRTQSYYTQLNVLMLLITTYTVRESFIKHYLPWFNFWWLLGMASVAVLTVAILDYRIVQPSEIAYLQKQNWKHRSPIRKELLEMENRINTKLDRLEKLVRELEDEQRQVPNS